MAFEFNATKGAIRWNYERMNELQLYRAGWHSPSTMGRFDSGRPRPSRYAAFYPGRASSMSYEDLKPLKRLDFLKSVVRKESRRAGLRRGGTLSRSVQDAMVRSWSSERWETVQPVLAVG